MNCYIAGLREGQNIKRKYDDPGAPGNEFFGIMDGIWIKDMILVSKQEFLEHHNAILEWAKGEKK